MEKQDVHGIAALLGVSVDTVYDLLKPGELPGRRVGPRGVRRVAPSCVQAETARRAFDTGDNAALTKALQSGAVRVKGG